MGTLQLSGGCLWSVLSPAAHGTLGVPNRSGHWVALGLSRVTQTDGYLINIELHRVASSFQQSSLQVISSPFNYLHHVVSVSFPYSQHALTLLCSSTRAAVSPCSTHPASSPLSSQHPMSIAHFKAANKPRSIPMPPTYLRSIQQQHHHSVP